MSTQSHSAESHPKTSLKQGDSSWPAAAVILSECSRDSSARASSCTGGRPPSTVTRSYLVRGSDPQAEEAYDPRQGARPHDAPEECYGREASDFLEGYCA